MVSKGQNIRKGINLQGSTTIKLIGYVDSIYIRNRNKGTSEYDRSFHRQKQTNGFNYK